MKLENTIFNLYRFKYYSVLLDYFDGTLEYGEGVINKPIKKLKYIDVLTLDNLSPPKVSNTNIYLVSNANEITNIHRDSYIKGYHIIGTNDLENYYKLSYIDLLE